MKYLGNNSKRLGKKIQKIINVSLNQLTKERQNVHEIQHFILVKKIEMLKFILDELHVQKLLHVVNARFCAAMKISKNNTRISLRGLATGKQ